MAERKPISQKLRFEVFKRDSFTCQYCGQMAPDVVLEADHINPVASGGKNELMNLVTACTNCNRGKGARELDDASIVKKQQKQLAELSERREQLKMMLEWKDGLALLLESEIDAIESLIVRRYQCTLSQEERVQIKRAIKQIGFRRAYDSTELAMDEFGKDGQGFWVVRKLNRLRLLSIKGK
jgi:hypothetical protein